MSFLQVGPCRWIPLASVDDVRDVDGVVEVRRIGGEKLRVDGEPAARLLEQVTGRIRTPKGAEKSTTGGSVPVATPAIADDTPATEPPAAEQPADEPKAKRSRKKKTSSDEDDADAPAAE